VGEAADQGAQAGVGVPGTTQRQQVGAPLVDRDHEDRLLVVLRGEAVGAVGSFSPIAALTAST
jgi:hypothetical protein